MLKRFLAYLTSLRMRLEHHTAGDVASIVSPLTAVQTQLEATATKAAELAEQAKAEAAALLVHAVTLDAKAVDAVKVAANIKSLVG